MKCLEPSRCMFLSLSFPPLTVFCLFAKVRPRREGGALPGQSKTVELLLRSSERRGQRSVLTWPLRAAPWLSADVVAGVHQICAAFTAEGLRRHSLPQRLYRAEQWGMLTVCGSWVWLVGMWWNINDYECMWFLGVVACCIISISWLFWNF